MPVIKLLKKINLEKIAKVIKIIVFFGLALLVIYVFFYFYLKNYPDRHKLTDEQIEKLKNEYLVEKEKFTIPTVKLPFVKSKQPIKDEDLPIPKKDVATTIKIVPNNLPPGIKMGEVKLVIDKKGNVYRTKDTPDTVKIEVVEWKPKLISLDFNLGYSLVYNGETFHCLSLDVLRIWKLHFGGDIGIHTNFEFKEFLAGPSVGIKFGEVKIFGLKTELDLTFGKDFLNQKFYGGISLRW